MEVSLAGFIGVPGVEEGGDDGEDVGWCGQEEGVDLVVAEGLDDGGEEVGYAAGGDEAEEHDHLEGARVVRMITYQFLGVGGWLTRIHILISAAASLNPWRKLWFLLLVQSS